MTAEVSREAKEKLKRETAGWTMEAGGGGSRTYRIELGLQNRGLEGGE